jgi:histidinol phosphatase-like PHP family hydrolase
MGKAWRLPVFLSGLVLLSQGFLLPSPVIDIATTDWASGFIYKLPPLYLVFAPFCSVADQITLFSYHQAWFFLGWVVLGTLFFLGWRRGGKVLGFFLVFLAWAILVPHPQARLVTDDPNILLIDFHSHTLASHDGRKLPPAFSAERNMRWHANQGYEAGFITDHNRIDAALEAKILSRKEWARNGYRSLEGEEVSLYRTHLVTLGVHEPIDNRPYDSDPAKIPVFLADMHKRNIPVIASIPEYWWYHWDGSQLGTYMDFIKWGITGFEVINSAPKALDFPKDYRRRIIDLCRTNNLPITGISDTHGWGYATSAWNAMRIPNWRSMDPDQLEAAVLNTLKTQGFQAVEVLERARYNSTRFRKLFFSPFIDAGIYWRLLQPLEVMSWLCWIWAFTFVFTRRTRSNES